MFRVFSSSFRFLLLFVFCFFLVLVFLFSYFILFLIFLLLFFLLLFFFSLISHLLDDATGKNDGSINGNRYFDCKMGHGMFVRPNSLKILPGPPIPGVPGLENGERGRVLCFSSLSLGFVFLFLFYLYSFSISFLFFLFFFFLPRDGSVQGTRYFECPMGHGMFVRHTSLKILPGPPVPGVPMAKKKARPASTTSSKGADPMLARRVSVNSTSPTPAPKQVCGTGTRVSANHPSPAPALPPPAPDASCPSPLLPSLALCGRTL